MRCNVLRCPAESVRAVRLLGPLERLVHAVRPVHDDGVVRHLRVQLLLQLFGVAGRHERLGVRQRPVAQPFQQQAVHDLLALVRRVHARHAALCFVEHHRELDGLQDAADVRRFET